MSDFSLSKTKAKDPLSMAKTNEFNNYSIEHIHFFDETNTTPLLVDNMQKLQKDNYSFRIIDVGCGDGAVLFFLVKYQLISPERDLIVGLDLSRTRLNRLGQHLKIKTICADALSIPVSSGCFDMVVSTQVIEHVNDDGKYLRESNRLLKENGFLYLSTVLKNWYGFYVYRNHGKFKLDPTHVREYQSKHELVNLFEKNGFKIEDFRVTQLMFPISDLFLRLLVRIHIVNPHSIGEIYIKKTAKWLRKIRIPIIGYYCVEMSGRKWN